MMSKPFFVMIELGYFVGWLFLAKQNLVRNFLVVETFVGSNLFWPKNNVGWNLFRPKNNWEKIFVGWKKKLSEKKFGSNFSGIELRFHTKNQK